MITLKVETVSDGKFHTVRSGIIYALDQNDKHILRGDGHAHGGRFFSPHGVEGPQQERGLWPIEEKLFPVQANEKGIFQAAKESQRPRFSDIHTAALPLKDGSTKK